VRVALVGDVDGALAERREPEQEARADGEPMLVLGRRVAKAAGLGGRNLGVIVDAVEDAAGASRQRSEHEGRRPQRGETAGAKRARHHSPSMTAEPGARQARCTAR
jgi:hypothetical protein